MNRPFSLPYSTVILFGLLFLAVMMPFAAAERIKIAMVGQDPDPVLAGDVVEVRFKVENLREATRGNVRLEVVPDYPFSLYQSSRVKDLGMIPGRQYNDDAILVDFKLRVDQDAVDGDNEIVVKLHRGEVVEEYEDMFFIDVENERIGMRPYVVASDLITGGNKGSFTIEIANIGGKDVEALELALLPSDDYKLLSTSNYVYIGDLERDDTESEDFTVYVADGVTEVEIPLTLTYEVNDRTYTDEARLRLNLLTVEEAERVGLVTKSYTWAIVSSIVVVVIGFFVIRRLLRSKKK